MKGKLDFKSLGFRVWLYIMAYSAAILLLLWLLQIVFINVFYRGIKTDHILNEAGRIQALYAQIQGQALETQLDGIVNKSDLFVTITNTAGESLYGRDPVGRDYRSQVEGMRIPPEGPGSSNPSMGHIGGSSVFEAFAKTILAEQDGESMQYFEDRRGGQMMLYGRVLQNADGEKALLMISSPLQPLKDTVNILSSQLLIITVAILALALVVSILIALSISRPLTGITGKAKLLARGRYDMAFDRGGYTEVNQLADTLNYATGALQQVEGMRRELIANVSHDLRTPLTMIKLYAEMIRDLTGENKRKRDQNVAVIVEECDRLTNLVQNLLDLSRLQSGVVPYQPKEFDLAMMIRGVLARYEGLAQKEGYRFVFQEDGPKLVMADEARIEQVLYNLINNAVNYAGEDKTVLLNLQDRGGTVRVSVADNGEGIAPEDIDLIWDRYYKVDKEHRRAVAGTGLGLSIVKSILDLHRMSYGVHSVKGQGAEFWFELEKV